MVALLQNHETIFRASTIIEEIASHSAWHADIRGLHAEKMLRGKAPYTYLLRQGESSTETEADYYVSFVGPDASIVHRPFIITVTNEGWFYANSGSGGPFIQEGLDHVLHSIMHCDKDDLVAFESR